MEGPGPTRGDSRFTNMYTLSSEDHHNMQYTLPHHVGVGLPGNTTSNNQQRQHQTLLTRPSLKRPSQDPTSCYDDRVMTSQQQQQQQQPLMEHCGGSSVTDIVDDSYSSLQPKKSPPSNGKKTKGRVKIKMEYIDNKLRRYTTFSKRKTGIMKKAYELSTLTGTQVMLLVASETGHVYTFATRKLQPMITSDSGKRLIQTCLNSPDPPHGAPGGHGGDQRMSATGFEETELTYNIGDEETKVRQLVYGGSPAHMGGGGHGGGGQGYSTHMDHHSMGLSPGQGYHQHSHGPCASPLPLPPSLAQQYAHPHMAHAHPQR